MAVKLEVIIYTDEKRLCFNPDHGELFEGRSFRKGVSGGNKIT